MPILQLGCDGITSSTASTKYLISNDAGKSRAWRGRCSDGPEVIHGALYCPSVALRTLCQKLVCLWAALGLSLMSSLPKASVPRCRLPFTAMLWSTWPRRGVILFIAAAGTGLASQARAQGKHTISHFPVAKEMKLNSGNTIPTLGLGVFLVKSSQEISTGLSAGYRYSTISGRAFGICPRKAVLLPYMYPKHFCTTRAMYKILCDSVCLQKFTCNVFGQPQLKI